MLGIGATTDDDALAAVFGVSRGRRPNHAVTPIATAATAPMARSGGRAAFDSVGKETALGVISGLTIDASFDSLADARLGCADWLAAMAPDHLIANSVAIAARAYILYDSTYDKGTPPA